MPTYARLPLKMERGSGAWLWDTDGKKYFDLISGIAVCSLGHAHPEIARAIGEQATKLIHTSNLYHIDLQERLADELCKVTGLSNAFFCNSGAEANEAALKLARKYGHDRNIQNPKIIVMENSFHGRTLFTLSATGNIKVQQGFEPLVSGFIRVPYGDEPAINAINDPEVVAILVEPVQGEGGVRIPRAGYLQALRSICSQNDWLLIFDEVQTGMARTGQWFGHQHEGITPDVMTLAKALGNGVPIGACIAGGKAAHVLGAGNHGSTFGGNPLACRAALEVIDIIRKHSLVERAAHLGQMILSGLQNRLGHHAKVIEVRGLGLMIGIELDVDCGQLVKMALDRGLLINVTAGNTLRLLPPLILTDWEAEELISSISTLVEDYTSQ
jgi:acetylornithine aminotransferase